MALFADRESYADLVGEARVQRLKLDFVVETVKSLSSGSREAGNEKRKWPALGALWRASHALAQLQC